jgi:hypothetical protein
MPSPKAPSEKLLARRAAKVVLNHAALDAITMAVADGAFDLARAVIFGADAPDATPYGEGLIRSGGVIAYVDRKLVATAATGPGIDGDPTVKKPRAAKLGPGIVVIGGYGFPARFQEAGTIHQPARPFVTPELMSTLPDAEGFIRLACVNRKVISAGRAARGDTFAASKARQAAKAAAG